jgi:hypothetical protein
MFNHTAFILSKLAKRGSYHGKEKGAEWRAAKLLADGDPSLVYAEVDGKWSLKKG